MSTDSAVFVGVYLTCCHPKTHSVEVGVQCSNDPSHKIPTRGRRGPGGSSGAPFCNKCGAETEPRFEEQDLSFQLLFEEDDDVALLNIPMADVKKLRQNLSSFAEECFEEGMILLSSDMRGIPGVHVDFNAFRDLPPKQLMCNMKEVRAKLAPLIKLLKKHFYKSVRVSYGIVPYEM